MMKTILMMVLLLPVFGFANDGKIICSLEGEKSLLISEINVSEEELDLAYGVRVSAQVSVLVGSNLRTAAILKSFEAKGAREYMPAGYTDILSNDSEGFEFEEGFNGSVLNSWVQAPSVKYQGQHLSCQFLN